MNPAELAKLIEIRDGLKDAFWDFDKWRWAAKFDQFIVDVQHAQEGVEDAEEQGERERSDRSESLPSTGGRTEEVELIARTLFKARAAGFVGGKHWDEEPNPLRGECWDDARDVARALLSIGKGGERESIATAVEGYTDILSEETARKVASRIRSLGERE